MADLAQRLEMATTRIELDQVDVARLLDMNPRTVARWLHRETQPRRHARERVLELIAVLEQLTGVLRAAPAHDWLFTPNPRLDYYKPAELLRAGEYRRVLAAIDALAEGIFM